jgi:hypothetical protein
MTDILVKHYLELCDLSSQEFWLLFGCELCGMPAQADKIIKHLIKYVKFAKNNSSSPINKFPFSLDSSKNILIAVNKAIEKKIIYRFDKTTIDKLDALYTSPILYQTMDKKCLCKNNIDISQLGFKIVRHVLYLLNNSTHQNSISDDLFFVIDHHHTTNNIDQFNVVSKTYEGVIEGSKINEGKLISAISELGPWADRWWQIYPSGYIGTCVLQNQIFDYEKYLKLGKT